MKSEKPDEASSSDTPDSAPPSGTPSPFGPPAILMAAISQLGAVEQKRIQSEERVTLAAIESDQRQQAHLFELEKIRLDHEHRRDQWSVRFAVFAALVEIGLVVGAVILAVHGQRDFAHLLFGLAGGGLAGAGATAWHHSERERRERRRSLSQTTQVEDND